jgi:hypothetical protein
MSRENVERTLLAIDARTRRDADAAIALWDPKGVRYPAIEGIMEGGIAYRGHAGVRQYFQDLAEYSEVAISKTPRFTTSATSCSVCVSFR